MLITDFTDNFENPFVAGSLPQKVPDTFSIGNIYSLELSKVFPVTVPGKKVEYFWDELCKFSPRMKQYSPYDDTRCNFAQEGVVCSLNMRVKEYALRIEGWLMHLQVCNRAELKKPVFKKFLQGNGFGSFVTRFLQFVDEPLYNRLLPNFPIDAYLNLSDIGKRPERTTTQTSVESNKRPDDGIITQAPKSRKISAAQVTFQQQFTQAPVEIPIDEDDEPSSLKVGDSQVSSDVSNPSQGKWLKYAVNQVPFSVFVDIPFQEVPEFTSFETTCVLFKIIPDTKLLFIRPYKRTMKVAEFKLVLKGLDGQLAFAEFHHEREIKKFFGVDEVEELIPRMEDVSNQLDALIGLTLKPRLQMALLDLDFGYQKPYWVCRSSLDELSTILD